MVLKNKVIAGDYEALDLIRRCALLLEFLPDLTEIVCGKYLDYKKHRDDPASLF